MIEMEGKVEFLQIAICYAVLSLVRAELPGLFSGALCSSDYADIVKPWCTCKKQLGIGNNVESWCKLYADFSQCVEDSLHEPCDNNNMYLQHVFSKRLVDKRMQYLCTEGDFPKVEECSTETQSCHEKFLELLHFTAQNSWNEENACNVTEQLASCLWTNQSCPPKLRHLLARFADGYTSESCTKYFKISVGDQCSNQRKLLFPNKDNMETCLRGVEFQLACMDREASHSKHSKDIFYNLDADRMNIYIYQTFRCEHYNKHKSSPCFTKKSEAAITCFKHYLQLEKKFVTDVKKGKPVSVQDVCSFYQNSSKCFQEAQPECKQKADYIVALLCTAFPKSCECPIRLNREYAHSFHRASRSSADSEFTRLSFLIYAIVSIWNLMTYT